MKNRNGQGGFVNLILLVAEFGEPPSVVGEHENLPAVTAAGCMQTAE